MVVLLLKKINEAVMMGDISQNVNGYCLAYTNYDSSGMLNQKTKEVININNWESISYLKGRPPPISIYDFMWM